MDPQAKIEKEKDGWVVYSEDGSKKLGGPYKTKEEAEERLRQVEHFKDAQSAERPAQARYLTTGMLAIDPKAFGLEFGVAAGGVAAPPFEEIGQVAAIRITGPLEQHPHWLWQDYETIRSQARAAFASHLRAVALCINSPGGAAAGCFELARELRAMAEESGKPLGVFIAGMATSAAYAIASSATAGIFAPPTSTVANLAVYEMHVDQRQADAQMGLAFTFVPSSGADLKLTGNPHVAQTPEQVAHTQAQVDLLTDYFYGLVEEMRGIPREQIRALRGATLLASQGIDRGLVDSLSDWTGFLAALETGEATHMDPKATASGKAAKGDEGGEGGEKKNPFATAIESLTEAAKADDDEGNAAKKMLADHYKSLHKAAEDGGGEEPKKEAPEEKKSEGPTEEEKKAKAAADEEEKKAQARAAAAGGVQAQASDNVGLAKLVHEMQAERAQEKETARRAELFAKRPDFSAEVRKSLASAPISVLEDAVKTWPRVGAAPGAAAAAAVPDAIPGVTDGARHGLDANHSAMLSRFDGKDARVAKAHMEGTTQVLGYMPPDAAAARAKELLEQGVEQRAPVDAKTVMNRVFDARPSK